MIYLGTFLLALGMIADWWTTRGALSRGGVEANPAGLWLIGKVGLNGALAVKLGLAGLLLFMIWNMERTGEAWAWMIPVALAAVHFWVSWRNHKVAR